MHATRAVEADSIGLSREFLSPLPARLLREYRPLFEKHSEKYDSYTRCFEVRGLCAFRWLFGCMPGGFVRASVKLQFISEVMVVVIHCLSRKQKWEDENQKYNINQ